MIPAEHLDILKLPSLKDLCDKHGLKVSGLKSDVVGRLHHVLDYDDLLKDDLMNIAEELHLHVPSRSTKVEVIDIIKRSRKSARDNGSALMNSFGLVNVLIKKLPDLSYSCHLQLGPMRVPSRMCGQCFRDAFALTKEAVQRMYTSERKSFYKRLNNALSNGNPICNIAIAYSSLLNRLIHEKYENLPDEVYRGMDVSAALAGAYQQNVGRVVYIYSFTSTSRSKAEARKFGTWFVTIELQRGCRDFVASVDATDYAHEKELLIACNAGFLILEVNQYARTMRWRLMDESHCFLPGRDCGDH